MTQDCGFLGMYIRIFFVLGQIKKKRFNMFTDEDS